MEPRAPKVRSMLGSELAGVIESKNAHAVAEQLSRLKDKESPAAAWAEALGTRLLIRDFLVKQKSGLATLVANQDPNLRQNIANFLHGLDTDLTTLTGDYGQDRPPAAPQALKEARINRLTREPADSLVEIVSGFSEQDSDKTLPADGLVSRTVSIRNGVVESLWSAAQSYNEGDVAIARYELDSEAFAINSNLDTHISTLLILEEAA